ncbi:MAG: hypothetical protein KZQ85_11745 [Candidatus Thiodiazotropha sp. (ex Myrtea sp. 'scaly one' KF741663)]|nr:hypothetical protein [Candidatus Thiodiazotropha sp. (ex Myrtea sp. 'scaly one' KF741663)]
MYHELVKKLELAICDMLMSQKESILDNLRNADFDSKFQAISFDVVSHDEFTPLSITFGTRADKNTYINTVADWKYYYLCRSDQIQSVNVSKAIEAVLEFCFIDNERDVEKENVVFFAASQALLSKSVWELYNSWQILVYEEKRSLAERQGKNLNAINWYIEEASRNMPLLHCIVTDGDLTAEANYCEMIRAIRLLNDHTDEVIGTIKT